MEAGRGLSAFQVIGCVLMLLLDSSSTIWLPVLIASVNGLPQGLNSLANQNTVYYQADPARVGASAGLLRAFAYLGAMVASAASGFFFRNGAGTTGLHHFAVFLIVVAALLLAVIVADPNLTRAGREPQPKGSPA